MRTTLARAIWQTPLAACLFIVAALPARFAAQDVGPTTMTLVVDETKAPRYLTSVHEEMMVRQGHLVLAYPKWIPGEHGPTGPVQQIASLRMRLNGAPLAWWRDPEDLWLFHLDVPRGGGTLVVEFELLAEHTISDRQAYVIWGSAILYPRQAGMRSLTVQPSIVLPPGWKHGGSLRVTGRDGMRVDFAPVSLERLLDSPLLAGEFFRQVPLSSAWPAELNVTGDSALAVERADDAHAFAKFGALIDQDRAMFGFKHWDRMFLQLSQSNSRSFDGLEHADAPWSAVPDSALAQTDQLERFGYPLLVHEQSHSWIGKYRRPAELYSKNDYQGPERASLLWVYEGLNQYVGFLLATRAGFNDAEYMRDVLAARVAWFSRQSARGTQPLVDTATANWILRKIDNEWASLRRWQDYYDEGALVWLRVDTLIRARSNGQRSLDDFLRTFFGQRDTGPDVSPHTREDLEAALSAEMPYDWHAFFENRIYKANAAAPTDGIEAAGWRLVFNESPNRDRFLLPGTQARGFNLFSVGVSVKDDGTILDVLPGTPADAAGLSPRMKVVGVGGKVFSTDALADAIAHTGNGTIAVVVRNADSVEMKTIAYGGGLKYPHLERIPGIRDHLAEILAPR